MLRQGARTIMPYGRKGISPDLFSFWVSDYPGVLMPCDLDLSRHVALLKKPVDAYRQVGRRKSHFAIIPYYEVQPFSVGELAIWEDDKHRTVS